MSALVLFTPTSKNGRVFTDAMLLNTSRIISFYPDPSSASRTILYYKFDDKSTWKFVLNHAVGTVATRSYEDGYLSNKFRKLHCVSQAIGIGPFKPVDAMRYYSADNIVFAHNTSSTTALVYIDGGNSQLKINTSHQVADISRVVSTSASLSAS